MVKLRRENRNSKRLWHNAFSKFHGVSAFDGVLAQMVDEDEMEAIISRHLDVSYINYELARWWASSQIFDTSETHSLLYQEYAYFVSVT